MSQFLCKLSHNLAKVKFEIMHIAKPRSTAINVFVCYLIVSSQKGTDQSFPIGKKGEQKWRVGLEAVFVVCDLHESYDLASLLAELFLLSDLNLHAVFVRLSFALDILCALGMKISSDNFHSKNKFCFTIFIRELRL